MHNLGRSPPGEKIILAARPPSQEGVEFQLYAFDALRDGAGRRSLVPKICLMACGSSRRFLPFSFASLPSRPLHETGCWGCVFRVRGGLFPAWVQGPSGTAGIEDQTL